ncbi:MAG: DUF4328 domain-containing protein [Marmoricola sp.]
MSVSSLEPRAAGWYPDPAGGAGRRWHDGQGWTAKVSFGQMVKPLGAPFAKLGDRLARLLILMCALNVAVLALNVGGYLAPELVLGVSPGEPGTVPVNLLAGLALVLIYLVGYVVTGLLWAVWQYRLAVSAPAALRRSPAMHVASWCLPVVSYWFPVRNMSDLWRSYGTAHRRDTAVGGPPLFLWWTCWIVSALFGAGMFPTLLATTVQEVRVLSLLGAVGALFSALAAGLAVLVVRRLSWQALLVHAG